jgi:hypothetical protein
VAASSKSQPRASSAASACSTPPSLMLAYRSRTYVQLRKMIRPAPSFTDPLPARMGEGVARRLPPIRP